MPKTPASRDQRHKVNRESISEASQRWDVHAATIRRRIADGTLTAYRCGPKLIRLDPEQVDQAFGPIPTTSKSDVA